MKKIVAFTLLLCLYAIIGIQASGMNSGPGDDFADEQGTVVEYEGKQYVRVTNARQFLRSFISGKGILVAKQTEINLTPLLEDKNWWQKNLYYYKWLPSYSSESLRGQNIVSEEVNDRTFSLNHCTILHPTDLLGTIDLAQQCDNWMSNDPYDTKSLGLGCVKPITALPKTAVRMDAKGQYAVYINRESEEVSSVWLADEKEKTVERVCVTNPGIGGQWVRMRELESDAATVPIENIASVERAWIVGEGRKIVVEGCPDMRNIMTYIIDVDTHSAWQLPSQEGVVSIDGDRHEIVAATYAYNDEGRYSYNRVYSTEGKFLRMVGNNSLEMIKNAAAWNYTNLEFTSEVNADGSITFNGMAEGEELSFRLTPSAEKENEYLLTDEPTVEHTNPFRHSRVKHIMKEGKNLLCVYDGQGMLHNVLSALEYGDGEKEAKRKWTRQLMGEYTSKYEEPLTIYDNGTIRFSSIELSYRHVTFNGCITGVVEIEGGTRLQGLWKAEIMSDGVRFSKVKDLEYGSLKETTGEEEFFTWARKDIPRFQYASEMLLNDEQFRRLDRPTLRLMRNEIFFHHGYKPTSNDLRTYLEDKQWYTPRLSNEDVFNELNLIEQLNIELIKTQESKTH